MVSFSILGRYRDYIPLRNELSTSKTKQNNQRWSLGTICVALSVLLNVFLLWRFWLWWPTALDNYQHFVSLTAFRSGKPPLIFSFCKGIIALVFLNPIERVLEFSDMFQILRNEYPLLSPDVPRIPATKENAIVTSLYTDAFATAIATLGHSLNKVNSTASRVVIYLPDKVSPEALCIASASGFTPQPVSRIAPPHSGVGPHFLDQYSKLHLWTLDKLNIKSVVYLDADTLVRRNFDELFTLPYSFAAVPDVYLDSRGFVVGFNAGVLFLRPSSDVYRDMVSKIATARYPAKEAEQSFLNHYFGKEALRLPYAYNANLAMKKRSVELWEDLMSEARIVHYTLVKPFLQGDYGEVPIAKMEKNVQSKLGKHGGLFKAELNEWAQAWRETEALYGDAFVECRANAPRR